MPTERSPYPSVLALLFVLLSSLDLAFTLLLGPDCEANPIAVIIWRRCGALGLYFAKGLAVAAILGISELTKTDAAGRLFAYALGAETVAIVSLLYFWWYMPRMAL